MPKRNKDLLDDVFAFIAARGYAGRAFIRSDCRKSGVVYARALAVLILRHEGQTMREVADAMSRSTAAVHELATRYHYRQDIQRDLDRWVVESIAHPFGNFTDRKWNRWPTDTRRPSIQEVRDAALALVGLPAGDWPIGFNAHVNLARAVALPILLGPCLLSPALAAQATGAGSRFRRGNIAWELMATPACRLLTAALIDGLLCQIQSPPKEPTTHA